MGGLLGEHACKLDELALAAGESGVGAICEVSDTCLVERTLDRHARILAG